MDKTVKLRAYSGGATADTSKANSADDQNLSLELAMKDAQIEEEKSRSLENLKTIVQLRENLKKEQEKSAAIVKKAAELEANDLARNNALLEEEKKKSVELLRTIEQLRESFKQEQAKNAEIAKSAVDLQSKLNKLAEVEDNQLVKKNALLEEEKKKSLEYLKTIEQLKEIAKQEQAKTAEMEIKLAAQDAKAKELAELLSKISSISAGVKAG